MRWTDGHDQAFVREILPFEPDWQFVADSLNQLEHPKFYVSQRSVSDRLKIIIDKHKKKTRDEEKASGISPEETELDIAIQEIYSNG